MNRRIRIISLLLVLVLLVGLTPQVSLRAQAEDDYTDLTIDLKYKHKYTGKEPSEIMESLGDADRSYRQSDEQEYRDAVNDPDMWRHVWKWTCKNNDEGSIRKYLTSDDPKDKYICLTADDHTEYHARTAWETMVVTTDKVLDLNGHELEIQYNRNRNNAKYDRYQNKFSDVHECLAIEVINGATLTIIDSSAWRHEGADGKGTGKLSFTAYMIDPYSYDINWYTTRDLIKVTNGNLVVYGGTFQAGRKKDQSKSKWNLDDIKTIIGNTVVLGVTIAEYACGCNTEVAKYQDILEAAKDAVATANTSTTTGEDDGTQGGSTVKEKDGSDAPKEKKEDTAKEAGKDGTDAGRNQTVQEKKADKNKDIADGKKDATPEGSSTGNNGQNSTAKNDKNAKIAEAENNVTKSFLDKDKIMGMVDSAFDLAKGIKKLFTDDGGSKVTQSIKGTVVSVGNDGTFVAYGGTFNGYGCTPNTRNAVIECTRLSTRRPLDKTKYQGGLVYIYGGTFNAYNGANVFNMVKENKHQTAYEVVQAKDGTRTVKAKELSTAETRSLETLYYENQEDMGKSGFAFTPLDTVNVQVRGGTFRCYYDLWNVATKEEGSGAANRFCKFPGTSGTVNLGVNSFNPDLIEDGRIQIVDTYGDGALVLLDERTEETAAVQKAGLYHYRLFCSDVELRAKYYLQVMPNEAVTNASASMQLATYQENERFAGSIWQNDVNGDNIRTPMTQTERYFEFMYNDDDAANYFVMPNFHDTQTGKYDVYGKKLDNSEVWYYQTPLDAKNNPIKDYSLTELYFQGVNKNNNTGFYLSQQRNDEDTWSYYLKNYDKNQYNAFAVSTQSKIRVGMRYFTYKMYRVDPLTRENLSESSTYGVDEPLFEVSYGVDPGSLRCKFPLLEVQEQIKTLRPDWTGYKPGEYYRIMLDVQEYVGIGYNGVNYGSQLPVAHTTSTILFRCSDVNETKDNGGAYKDHDFTALQWVDTPKAGSTAKVRLVNAKAGMTDYAAVNKIFDLYYQWWEVDASGDPVKLLAGTDNVYDGTGVKSDHKPSVWNVGKDGKTYVNTSKPGDPSSYVNGLPADPKKWTAEMLHMYSAQTVERKDLTKDKTRTLSLMNNNVFKTNTDTCYIPEDFAGKNIRVRVIAINYTSPGRNVYDVKQTFWSHAFKVASAGSNANEIEALYPTGKEYASSTDPIVVRFREDTTVNYSAIRKLRFVVTHETNGQSYTLELSDLDYSSRDELPEIKFPDDFSGLLDPGVISTGGYSFQTRLGRNVSFNGQTMTSWTDSNVLSFRYESPATSLNLTEGSKVEYSLTDVQNGVYSDGLRLIEVVPSNASTGFDYDAAVTSNFSVAYMDQAGLVRFGGAEGSTDISLRGPDNKITTVTVKVTRDAAPESAVANTNLGDNPFTDVKEDQYYYEAVLWAVGHKPKITEGTSPDTFGPGKVCTRGQVVTFLWRAAGEPDPETTSCPFTDVKASNYFYTAVLWAVEEGITSGLNATTFGPGKACTRGQVVTFLWRAAGEPAPTTTSCPFTDVKSSDYFYKAVLWAVENGVTSGVNATTFAPARSCTRGQIVTFLFRADSNANMLRVVEHPGTGLIDSDKHTTFPLTVKAAGGKGPYTYQWHRLYYAVSGGGAKQKFQHTDTLNNTENTPNRDELIAGATSATYNAPSEGWYECVITDARGKRVKSGRSKIADRLRISSEPADGYCTEAMPYRLSVDISGGVYPRTVQWYKDGQPFGAKDKLIIEVTEPGKYYCVAKDDFGQTAQSRTATVRAIGQSGINILSTNDFLLYAEDVVYVTSRGLVVQGRVANGAVATGDTIRVLTYNRNTKQSVEKEFIVESIEMFHRITDSAEKGNYVGLLLKNAEKGDVTYGDTLVGKASALHDLPANAKLVGKVELNDQRSTPFQNGDKPQFYWNSCDVTGVFVNVNGDPIAKNTTREGVVMQLADTAHRPVCFYPGQVLHLRMGGKDYGTFTIMDIQNK